MGSGASKGKRYQDSQHYGELYLQTDQTTYRPGETVTGTIHLDLKSQYPGHQLFLKLKGKEVVHFLDKHGDRKNYYFTEQSETRDIIKQNALVYSWDTSAPIGQFSIPFSFLLPSHLPASFYQHEYRFLAFVEYKLEAFLQPPHADCPKMKYKQPITIREIPLANDGDLHIENTTPLKSCCCCDGGSNVMKGDFKKNFYSCGEEANISIELDNSNSKLNPIKMYARLVQKIELKAKSASQFESLHKTKPATYSESLFKGPSAEYKLSPGNKVYSQSFTFTIPKFKSEFDYQLEFDKYKFSRDILNKSFQHYTIVHSATNSSLISSSFYLRVYCQMDAIDGSYVHVECPISILVPDSPPPIYATPPPNWQPEVFQRTNVAFSEQNHQQQMGGTGNMMDMQGMPNGNPASMHRLYVEAPHN